MANLRVLVADSDTQFRSQASSALSRQGYVVIPAGDGNEALARIENGPIDVIVTEVALPQQDGLEILHAAQRKSGHLPVILVAEPRNIGTAAIGVRAGAFDYLVKPVDDMTRLALLIDRASGRSTPPAAQAQETAHAEPETPPPSPTAHLLDTLAAGVGLNPFLERFAIELARLLRASHTLILLAHSDNQLHLAASHGYTGRTEAARWYNSAAGETFALRVASDRRISWQSGLPQSTPLNSSEPSQLVGVPLVYANQVLGVAIAHAHTPREAFPATTLNQLHELGQQAAVGVELARITARASRLEPRDAATGLFKREHFLDLADRDFRRAWRFNQALSALVLDLDNFGRLHLQLGPAESDSLLRQVAHVTRSHVRSVDLVGRLDTDRFGFVLLQARREHALLVAERLRVLVAEIQLQIPDDVWQVTASLGVASYPRDNCTSIHDLFSLAEQAVRLAKRAGRNRVEVI